jgi:hypothetical protein
MKEVFIEISWRENKNTFILNEFYKYDKKEYKNYMNGLTDYLFFKYYEYSTIKNGKYHSINEEHSCFIYTGKEDKFLGRLSDTNDIINSSDCNLEVGYHENGLLHNLNNIAYYYFGEYDCPLPEQYISIENYYIHNNKYEKEEFLEIKEIIAKQKREILCKYFYNNTLIDMNCSILISSYIY